jgi:hypothetical protein
LNFKTKKDIFIDGQPFEKMILLQHISDRENRMFPWKSLHGDLSLFRYQKSGYQIQDGTFSASAGPHQRDKLAFLNGKTDL